MTPILGLCTLLVAVTLAACNDASINEEDAVPEVTVATRWITAHAQSVEALAAFADAVFVGRVTHLAGQREEPLAPGADRGAGQRGSLPISVYRVEIETPLAGSLTAGATIHIEQEGGLSTSPDGNLRRFLLEGDEPLQPGQSYLFFANQKPNGSYVAPPFGRLPVDLGQNLVAPAFWAHLPAVQELAGRDLAEVGIEVESLVP